MMNTHIPMITALNLLNFSQSQLKPESLINVKNIWNSIEFNCTKYWTNKYCFIKRTYIKLIMKSQLKINKLN